MIVCPDCGAENRDDAPTCARCGAALPGSMMGQVRFFATVVNSDLKGSTALGERLDPESLREVLTRYFDAMRTVYESHGGTIEKIIGDAVVAVFGVPVQQDDDAIRAVEAAAESVRVLADLNERLERTWGVRLVARTGVSSGVVIGGGATVGQHVLTGDTMRISSAMEQHAPAFEVLLAESTVALVRDLVEVEAVEPVTPKGMTVAIPAYVLRGTKPRVRDERAAVAVRADAPGSSSAVRESRKTVTIVFADPRPTSLTDEPPSAEALRAVMSRYFDAMRAALARHGGTVEKFIGDAVMAVYGLPVRHEDDAIRAIRAAAEMQAALPALNDEFGARWGIVLRNHIGVNTGEVIAGDASTGQRLVTGDAVNTAARLEQAAGPAEIILGNLTYQLARELIDVEALPPLALKGKAEPVPAYRVLAVRDRAVDGGEGGAPFVGREAEMRRLAETLGGVRTERRTQLLTIVGDAGVGKSRLIREFASAAAGSARVVRGRCLPYGDGITFWPLSEVVRDAAAIGDDDAQAEALVKIRDLLVGAGLDDDARSSVADRVAAAIGIGPTQFPVAELFWGARRLLESLAGDRPLVMIVDDIHSAEPTFLDLLDHLVATAESAPILLVCSARHELVTRHPEWSETQADRMLVLQPLSDGDTSQMVGELLGQTGIDRAIVDRIVGAAEGNPLFVEQMVSMLVDNGTLRRDGDRWVVADDARRIVVPPTIHALLAARLDDLAREERAVVEPASIVGLVFPQAAVEHLIDPGQRPRVPTSLAALARKQFVRSEALDDDAAYRFGHQLIRDTAYGSLLKRERVAFHERFVDWADAVNRRRGRETEFEEILGYHLEQAHRYRSELGPLDDEAIEVGVRASARLASAGRRALARGDFPAAANLLERSARLLEQDHPDRPRLLVAAGEAYLETAEFATADALLDTAAAEAEVIGARSDRATAELVRHQLHLRSEASTAIEDVRVATEATIRELDDAGDPAALARAWRLLELVHGMSGHYAEAGQANERAVAYARAAGDRVIEMRLLASSAMAAFYGPMPVPEAIARCDEVLRVAEGDRRAQATTLAPLAHLRAMRGDFEGARADYRRGRAILEELGLRFDASTMSIDSGPVELLAGDLDAAEAELRKDYEGLDAIGERNYISTISGLLAETLYRQGRFDAAATHAAICEEVAAPSDVYSQYLWRGIRGKLLALGGSVDAGVELAESGVAATLESDDIEGQANALVFLAEAQAAGGRRDAAMRSLEEARVRFEAKGNIVSAARASTLLGPLERSGAPA